MENNGNCIRRQNTKGDMVMTLEKARDLSSQEFIRHSRECNNFNDEKYKNHQKTKPEESIADFILEGSFRIKNNPKIKGKLL